MDNIIVETDGDVVTVIAVRGHAPAFREAAKALSESGPVRTVTGTRGVALETDQKTAKKAGVVKATRSTRKKAE